MSLTAMKVFALFLCVLASSKSVFTDLEREANFSSEASKVSRARLGDDVHYGVGRQIIISDPQSLLRDTRKRVSSDQGTDARNSGQSAEVKAPEIFKLIAKAAPSDRKRLINNSKMMFHGTSSLNNTRTYVVGKKHVRAAYLKGLRAIMWAALKVTDTVSNSESKTNSSSRRKRAYEVNDPFYMSINEYDAIFKKLPVELQYGIAATNHFENALLLGYAAATVSKRDGIDSQLARYIQSKCRERMILKALFEKADTAAQELLTNYKSLRKGVAWLYVKLDRNLKTFFATPSAYLTEYDVLKRDEIDSIDGFLGGKMQCQADVAAGKNETVEAVEKAAEEKAMADVAEVKKVEEEEEELMRVKDADTTRSLVESYEAMREVRRRLPEDLRRLVEATDVVEERLIETYATDQSASTKILDDYYAAKKLEREQLKELASELGPGPASELINNYKTLRKGRVWNYVKLQDRFKTFFRRFSAGLLEFETLKMDELTSIDRFLNLPSPSAGAASAVKTAEGQGPSTPDEGRTIYAELLSSFEGPLKDNILQTDRIEMQMLDLYAKSQSVPSALLDAYRAARNEEREALRKFIAERPQNKTSLVESYKALRNGTAWTFVKTEQQYADFFKRPSPALTDYEALKKEEQTNLDSLLDAKPKKHKRAKMKHAKRKSRQAATEAPMSIPEELNAFPEEITPLPEEITSRTHHRSTLRTTITARTHKHVTTTTPIGKQCD